MTNPYGNVRPATIQRAIDELRAACRDEGTPRIQEAWDRLEPWVDVVYQGDKG